MGPAIITGPATSTTGGLGRSQATLDQREETLVTYDSTGSRVSFTPIYINPKATRPASTDGGSSSGGLGALDRPTSIVVIVLATVIAGVALWTAVFLLVRRRRIKAAQCRNSRSTKGGGDDEVTLENGPRQQKRPVDPRRPTAPKGPTGYVKHERQSSGDTTKSIVSPVSELDGTGTPAIGTTPNPAELEGDMLIQPPARTWVHQRLWPKSTVLLQPPQSSPRSMQSARSRSTRRTLRESFGEKVNDPAKALGKLRISSSLTIGRPSPTSRSPSVRSFRRTPRSPKTPPKGTAAGATAAAAAAATTTADRRSAQLPKSSRKSAQGERMSRVSTPGRGKSGWQEDRPSSIQSDAVLCQRAGLR